MMYKGAGRNRMIKRMICGVLATVMICTSVDVSTFAAENGAIDVVVAQNTFNNESMEQPIPSEKDDIRETEDIYEGNRPPKISFDNKYSDDDREEISIWEGSEQIKSEKIVSNDGDEDDNPFAGGSGTEEDPYLISSVSQMREMADFGGYFKLITDITLNNWTPLEPAWACFDGGGHTIHNLKVIADDNDDKNYDGLALFKNIRSIKNLTIENAEIIDNNSTLDPTLAVFAYRADEIENCKLKGDVLLRGNSDSAGFVYMLKKSIKNCENYAHITVERTKDIDHVCGGFVVCAGDVNVVFENLVNKEGSSITSEGIVAGILDSDYGGSVILKNCTNYADITGGKRVAGIVDHAEPVSITDCHNYGTLISAKGDAVGIIHSIVNRSNISFGHIDDTTSRIVNCSNEGNLVSQNRSGGICAGIVVYGTDADALLIEGCYNTGTIEGANVAGIIYACDIKRSRISGCCNRGTLVPDNSEYRGFAGGIIVLADVTTGKPNEVEFELLKIDNCYNGGAIKSNSTNNNSIVAGGIIAYLTESHNLPEGKSFEIRNCYNSCSFKGFDATRDMTAGVVADFTVYETFSFVTKNCYCLDKGYAHTYRTDDYMSKAFAGVKTCTDVQMKKQETYEGFDFGSVWAMGEDDYPYPILIGSGGSHSGYEITLDPNGGTVSDMVLYTNKTGKLISLPRAKKDGKHFLGWYSALESGDRITKDNVFEGDTTLYAHWGDYDESKKVTVYPQKPFNGERGVGFLSINPASGTNDAFDIEFRTYRHVREADFEAGTIRIYEYDAEGNLGHEPVFTLDKKNAKVTFNDNKEYENASYVTIHLGSSSGIGKALGYNRKYSIEIDKEFLGFEDPECYMFVEKGDWNFTTGVVARFNDEEYAKANVNLSYWFDPGSLDFSKSSYDYDWNMAVFAYMATLSAFENAAASTAFDTNKIMDDYDGAANARTFLVDRLGFENFRYNDGYKNKPTTHSIGVCAASKKMNIGGEDYTVIVMPIRGAGYGAEWASNSNVGSGTDHAGFREAADQAMDFFKSYLRDSGINISGKIKVIVTGYSRAGGTANLVTADLDKLVDRGSIGVDSISLMKKDIFGYCFEPPATTKDDNRKNLNVYGNIHCLINQRDLVPMVPNEVWNYGRYGKEYYYRNIDFSKEGNKGFHSALLKQYTQLSGKNLNMSGMSVNNKPVDGYEWLWYVLRRVSQTVGKNNVTELYPVMEFLLKDGLGEPMGSAVKYNLYDLIGNAADEFGVNADDPKDTLINYPTYTFINLLLFCMGHEQEIREAKIKTKFSVGKLLYFIDEYSLKYDPMNDYSWVEKQTPVFRQTKILESIAKTFNTGYIMQEHYPLLNFAWLLYYKDGELTAGNAHYKKVYVKCPVDVEVYDEENRLAATIINNEANVVDNNEGRPVDIVAYVDQNEQKIIIYPEDRNYSIRIKATGSGTMDFSEEDYAVGEGVTKRMDYLDIPIEAGTQLSGAENADGDIVISKDGSVLTPEVHTDIVKYNVHLTVEGNGYTIGSGEYTQHDYVAANAVSYPDTVFEGWYEGDMLVSEDAEYRFRVEKDIELTARFKTIDGIRISSIEPQEYTGYALTPDIMLYDGSQELTQGADYTVSYKNNKNAFTFEDEDKLTDAQKKKAPQALIKMKGSYTGQKTVYFKIEPLKIDDGSLFDASLKPGKALKAVFKYNGKALKENRDYKVDAINSDSVTIIGTGNFTGTCTFPLKGGTELTVVPISKAIADPIPVQYYTGAELTGDTFKMGPDGDTKYEFRICYPKGEELKEGSDYEIAKVINGRKPGTGTVVIKGLRADGTGEGSTKYSFTGERYLKFKIAPRSIELAEVTSSGDMFAVPYNKAGAKIPGLTVTVNGTALKEGRDYTVKYSKNTAFVGTSTTSGSDPVAVITGKGNYKDTKKVNFTIVKREFSTVSGITVVAPDRPEGKKAGDYATAVKVFDSEGKLLKAGTDYEKDVKYFTSDGNEASKDTYPKAGDILTVKVTGRGGYLDGTIEASYKILNKGETNDISKASIKIDQLSFGNVPATLDGNNAGKVHAAIGKDKKALTFSTDGTSGDLMVLPGSYVNNDRKGTAAVTLIGINGYSGCKTVKFKVGARSLAEWWKGLFK